MISQKQDGHNIYGIMKTMFPLSYHYNGFVATHALGDMMYGYTLLVPMNQRVLNKLSKEHVLYILKQNVKNELLKTHNLLVYKLSAFTSF